MEPLPPAGYTSRELEALLARHFLSVEVVGVRASNAIEEIERARIQFAQRVASLDPLGLLRIVPAPLLVRLGRLRRRTLPAKTSWPHVVQTFTPPPRTAMSDSICWQYAPVNENSPPRAHRRSRDATRVGEQPRREWSLILRDGSPPLSERTGRGGRSSAPVRRGEFPRHT